MDKTQKTDNQEFKTIAFFRKVKEQIAKETYNISFQELKEYLKKRKLQTK